MKIKNEQKEQKETNLASEKHTNGTNRTNQASEKHKNGTTQASEKHTNVEINQNFSETKTIDYNPREPDILSTLNIFIFCSNGIIEPIEEYISRGGNVNLRIPNKNTLLNVACENDHFEIAELLLQNGANPNVVVSGFIPLHFSSEKMTKLLLDYKADPNIMSSSYGVPLNLAFFRKDESAKLLVKAGAIVDMTRLCYSKKHDLYPFITRIEQKTRKELKNRKQTEKNDEKNDEKNTEKSPVIAIEKNDGFEECFDCRNFCKNHFFETGLILKEAGYPFLFVAGVIQNLCGYPHDEIINEFGLLWYD